MVRTAVAVAAALLFAPAAVAQDPPANEIEVRVPADAKLLVNHKPTPTKDGLARVVLPKIEAGKQYDYSLAIEYLDGAETVTRTRTVTVKAGESPRVDFTTRAAAAGDRKPAGGGDLEAGRAALAAAAYDTAIDAFTRALQADPANVEALRSRGDAWSRRLKAANAVDDYTAALRLDPRHVAALIGRARAVRATDPAKAVADFTAALSVDPQSYDALHGRAITHASAVNPQARKLDLAIADADELVRRHPAEPKALLYRAGLWSQVKMYDRAAADYSEVLRTRPTDVPALTARASVWAAARRFDKEIEDHTTLVLLRPGEPYQRWLRARAYANAGQHEDALADCNELIRRGSPGYQQLALRERAAVHTRLGKLDKAAADYTDLLRANPQDAAAQRSRGDAHYALGHFDKALADYDAVLKASPADLAALIGRGRTRTVTGEYEKAIADYEAALRLNPDDKYGVKQGLAEVQRLKAVAANAATPTTPVLPPLTLGPDANALTLPPLTATPTPPADAGTAQAILDVKKQIVDLKAAVAAAERQDARNQTANDAVVAKRQQAIDEQVAALDKARDKLIKAGKDLEALAVAIAGQAKIDADKRGLYADLKDTHTADGPRFQLLDAEKRLLELEAKK